MASILNILNLSSTKKSRRYGGRYVFSESVWKPKIDFPNTKRSRIIPKTEAETYFKILVLYSSVRIFSEVVSVFSLELKNR